MKGNICWVFVGLAILFGMFVTHEIMFVNAPEEPPLIYSADEVETRPCPNHLIFARQVGPDCGCGWYLSVKRKNGNVRILNKRAAWFFDENKL